MAAPSVPFTTLAAREMVAGGPFPSSALTSLYNNTVHLEEWMGKDYTAAQDHDHNTLNSAPVALPGNWNLITDPFPQTSGMAAMYRWHLSGAVTQELTGLSFTRKGDAAWSLIFDATDSTASRKVLGSGADLTISVCVVATAALTAGAMQFGFVDGDSYDFMDGTVATIHYTDLTTTWRRFWAASTSVTVAESCGVLLKCPLTFTGGSVKVSAIACNTGTTLGHVTWPPDVIFNSYSYSNAGEVPVLQANMVPSSATRLEVA